MNVPGCLRQQHFWMDRIIKSAGQGKSLFTKAIFQAGEIAAGQFAGQGISFKNEPTNVPPVLQSNYGFRFILLSFQFNSVKMTQILLD